MPRLSLLARVWMTLIAFAVIAMPVNAEHLHLCFDGGEAPATVHATEDGAGHPEDQTHRDADVSLDGAAVAKKFEPSFGLSGLLPTVFIVLRVPVTTPTLIPCDDVPIAVTAAAVELLPPLRGPPV